MATDFQFRAEQKRRLYLLCTIAAKPEKLQELLEQTIAEMAEEDVALIEKLTGFKIEV